jgi:DNA-binding IclR family transcriptional regulator
MMSSAVDQKSGLQRALTVISLIAQRAPEPLGVSTVARDLELPKAVAQRILKEFTAAGFLVFDENAKNYRLGPGSLTLGLAALRTLDIPRIARPYLQRMVTRTGETATLSVREGWCRIYVDQVLSPHEIRMSVSVGTEHPLHAGSSSKAILAHLRPDEIDQYVEQHRLEAVTATTITDEQRLREELAEVRRQGFAWSRGERQVGAGSVAAPIFHPSGDVFGSISLCGPLDRFEALMASHATEVVETARLVSEEAGSRYAVEGGAR